MRQKACQTRKNRTFTLYGTSSVLEACSCSTASCYERPVALAARFAEGEGAAVRVRDEVVGVLVVSLDVLEPAAEGLELVQEAAGESPSIAARWRGRRRRVHDVGVTVHRDAGGVVHRRGPESLVVGRRQVAMDGERVVHEVLVQTLAI